MIVKVPASSANLGPGFDCFGLAWQLYNEIGFERIPEGLEIQGCDERYKNENNLAYRAFARTLELCEKKAEGLRIDFRRCDIPVSRGLGSSSALIVAGVLAANELYLLGLSRDELFAIATEIEGHPDNVAPAIYGGLSVSTISRGRPLRAAFPLSDSLVFAALIPPFRLSTAKARAVLPNNLSRADAIFNVSRSALLLSALGSGDTTLLRSAMEDKIHQPYRIPLIKGFEDAQRLCFESGGEAMCISGAGPTLLCAAKRADFVSLLSSGIHRALPGWRVVALKPDNEGAKII